MKPLRVNIHLKNNILVTLREQAGFTPRQMAEQIGIGYQPYLDLESMRVSALHAQWRNWSKNARIVAAYWGKLPEELWPDVILRVKKTSGSFNMDERQVQRLLASPRESLPELPEEIPERAVLSSEIREQVDGYFNRLLEREEISAKRIAIFKMALGWDDGVEHCAEEVAQQFGISRERVRQIVARLRRELLYHLPGLREIYYDLCT